VGSIHWREERCPLRGAFRNWFLFTVLLATASFLVFWDGVFQRYIYAANKSLSLMTGAMEPFLLGPEFSVDCLLELLLPAYRQWSFESKQIFLLTLFAARLCAMFAWGVFRLRRGKRTPYAETLWLLVICAIALAVLEDLSFGIKFEIATLLHRRFGVPAALLTMTGIVVFVFQRRRPPTWKRKMPE